MSGVTGHVQVRPACNEDADGLHQLYVELAGSRPKAMPGVGERAAEVLAAIIRQPDRILLVATDAEGRLAGTVDLIIVRNLTYGARPWAVIENVVVATSHRRRGIATALMHEAIRLAKEAGCYKMQLISRPREEVHAFYRSLGMESGRQGFKLYF